MKNINVIMPPSFVNKFLPAVILIILAVVCACEMPLALGSKIILEGPAVTIEYPEHRQPVDGMFYISGSVTDKTDIKNITIKAAKDNKELPVQWQYNGRWQYSVESGAWQDVPDLELKDGTTVTPEWEGDIRSANWKVPINMLLGNPQEDGLYQFSVTALNTSGFSGDNSSQARSVIFYKNPPKVSIISPMLYYDDPAFPDPEYEILKAVQDIEGETNWQQADLVGKFINKEFNLQWQIEDENEVWSLKIKFIDTDGNEVFVMGINDVGAMPAIPSPEQTLKRNQSITVPDLSVISNYSEGNLSYEVLKPVSGKTKLRIEVECRNLGGIETEDRFMGEFIYWSETDTPWIELPAEMPTKFDLTQNLYAVFQNFNVPLKAYDDDGIQKIEYTISKINPADGEKTGVLIPLKEVIPDYDTRNFTWSFGSIEEIGQFVIEAKVYDKNNLSSQLAVGYFELKDISMPDILIPYEPGNPLWNSLDEGAAEDWHFHVKGKANDTSAIHDVYMVWINPRSANYAAMSQLAYFRETDYEGWKEAEAYFADGGKNIYYEKHKEGYNDPVYKNKIWKLNVDKENIGLTQTGRKEFEYSIDLSLKNDLNILPNGGSAYDYLKSQVFVLKVIGGIEAEKKSKTIVWAPEGSTSSPQIELTNVTIYSDIAPTNSLDPGIYEEPLRVFEKGDRIEIEGTWYEASMERLGVKKALFDYLKLNVGNALIPITGTSINPVQNTWFEIDMESASDGLWHWKAYIIVGSETDTVTHALRTDFLKDALLVNVEVTNIGGNKSEDQAIWIVENTDLQLLRIGSETADGSYNAGKTIRFFLEFNKPVTLKSGTPGNVKFDMNSGGQAVLDYSAAASTMQYFTYTVGAGENTDELNISGMSSSPEDYIWKTAEGEELKIVFSGSNNKVEDGQPNINVLPIDGTRSLSGVTSYIIDTIPPVFKTLSLSGNGGYYGNNNTVYINAEFSEAVYLTVPAAALTFQINNGVLKNKSTTSISSNGASLLFAYPIEEGDTTSGNALVISGITGVITDLAGNAFAASSFSGLSESNRTPKDTQARGVIIQAVPLGVPVVTVSSSTTFPISSPSEITKTSSSASTLVLPGNFRDSELFYKTAGDVNQIKIGNYYRGNLYVKAAPAGSFNPAFDRIEYSVNFGKDKVNEAPNTVISETDEGYYAITARQVDLAGNESPWSQPITLNWDVGDLLQSVSGTQGGTFSADNIVPIILTFRDEIKVKFTQYPVITINADDGNNYQIPLDAGSFLPGLNVLSNTFTVNYKVIEGHNTRTNTIPRERLNVTGLTNISAEDESGTNVSGMINLTLVNSASNPRNLKDMNEIYIQTGKPELVSLNFTPGTYANGAFDTTKTINTDDSVPGRISITFDKPISRGIGNIKLSQDNSGDDYRMPAVLTEAQYNFYSSTVPRIRDYYKKGTNGYISGGNPGTAGKSDTSTKYILDFWADPYTTTYKDDPVKTDDLIAIRQGLLAAEGVSVSVNSSFVEIDGNTIHIYLYGTNSLKVPGAAYNLEYPRAFINDDLGLNECDAHSRQITTEGLSRPYIRSLKPSEKISEQTGTANLPRFYIDPSDRAIKAQVRMDTRTPGSVVRYVQNSAAHNVNSATWTNNPASRNPSVAEPAIGAGPNATSPLVYNEDSTPIEVGDGTGRIQGYKMRYWAISEKNGKVSSTYAEEMLYRSVLTFYGNNGANTYLSNFSAGDQIWVRGGNESTNTTVAGFPLTWRDDYAQLQSTGEQAGIRLLTRITANNTTTLAQSEWQWVTWDINTAAYVILLLGRDTSSSAAQAKQFGPRETAVQRDNWTYLSDYYRLHPGEHRYLTPQTPNMAGGSGRADPFSFSPSFENRPVLENTSGFVN